MKSKNLMGIVGMAAWLCFITSTAQARYPGESEERLLARTTHADAKVRSDAATILHEYQNEKVFNRLMELTQDPDWRVRYASIQSLGRWADPRVKAQILPLASDPMPYVRMISVWALAQINDADTFPQIIEATNDPSREVRSCAQLSLSNLTERRDIRDYQGWKKWWEQNKDKVAQAKQP